TSYARTVGQKSDPDCTDAHCATPQYTFDWHLNTGWVHAGSIQGALVQKLGGTAPPAAGGTGHDAAPPGGGLALPSDIGSSSTPTSGPIILYHAWYDYYYGDFFAD